MDAAGGQLRGCLAGRRGRGCFGVRAGAEVASSARDPLGGRCPGRSEAVSPPALSRHTLSILPLPPSCVCSRRSDL